MPDKHADAEGGFIYATSLAGGDENLYPSTELRLGLPKLSEFYIYLPNYTHHQVFPFSGSTPVSMGFKHLFYENKNVAASFSTRYIQPSGSHYYGAQSAGAVLSGIVSYDITEQFGLLGSLTISYQGLPASEENAHWTAISPDIVLNYALTPKLTCFAEVYGVNKASPFLGSGYNFNGGLVFLARKNLTLDIAFSHRLSGRLGGFEAYLGVGGSLML